VPKTTSFWPLKPIEKSSAAKSKYGLFVLIGIQGTKDRVMTNEAYWVKMKQGTTSDPIT
jgi:hypothetical protein